MKENREQKDILPELLPVESGEQNAAFEIVPGMTAEEMKALFFDKAMIEPPYKVWQLNSKGHRYYYRYNEAGEPEFFPSVTTILSQTVPQSPWLTTWIATKGLEEAERYKEERASYGTFMHAQFERLLIGRSYDLDTLKDELKRYIEYSRLPENFIYYADDLKKDVLAFAQFVMDYDVRPIAVEISLVHPIYNYAGMIDLVCTMREKPESDTRITAIVDFKSGRKGFYDEHELQLGMYRDMWNTNFPQHEVERIFNFSPKDWRKKPTYNLKDQTKSENLRKIPYLLEIARIEDAKIDNVFTSITGSIDLDGGRDLSENITTLTLSELVKSKSAQNNEADASVEGFIPGAGDNAAESTAVTKNE